MTSEGVTGNEATMEPQSDQQTIVEPETDQQVADGTVVKQPFYTQSTFDLEHDRKMPTVTVRQEVEAKLREWFTPSRDCCMSSLLSFFPFIGIMRNYSVKNDLFGDIVSGLTVGVMHIPQGMAYGMLADLEPVYGLYTSFFPVIFYFFFGTSKHISVGTFAVVSLMVGLVVEKSDCCDLVSNSTNGTASSDCHHLNASDYKVVSQCRVGYAMAVTLLVGIYQLLLGILRCGFVTVYLPDALTKGLTAAAAIHVITSQIKHVFGVNIKSYHGPLHIVFSYIALFENIASTNVASIVMTIICIIIIYCVQKFVNPIMKKKLKIPLPIELIVLIFSTLISWLGNFSSPKVFSLDIVGEIPSGLLAPVLPPANRLGSVAVDAISISIVSFAINYSLAKLFAQKHGYDLVPNQELKAYGVMNILGSMFNSFVASASLSRSVLQETVGCRTQVAGLVSSCLILFDLLFIGSMFRTLPTCVLAAIIIVNLRSVLLQVTELPKLLKISLVDMLIFLVTYVGVVLTDVDLGLLVGVAFALLSVVFRTERVHSSVLGLIPQTDVYEDVTQYASAKEIKGIKIFRFAASVCFPNSDSFIEKLYKKSECDPGKIKALMKSATLAAKDSDVVQKGKVEEGNKAYPVLSLSHVILDCSCIVFIDAAAITMFNRIIDEYNDLGVKVSFAGCRVSIYDLMKSHICTKKDKDGNVIVRAKAYVTVHDAVVAAAESSN